MECHTQEEIAEAVGMGRKTVDDRLETLAEKYREYYSAKVTFHPDTFDRPLYNVWKQQEKSGDLKHFGNSETRWVENLLYLYTGRNTVPPSTPQSGRAVDLSVLSVRGLGGE